MALQEDYFCVNTFRWARLNTLPTVIEHFKQMGVCHSPSALYELGSYLSRTGTTNNFTTFRYDSRHKTLGSVPELRDTVGSEDSALSRLFTSYDTYFQAVIGYRVFKQLIWAEGMHCGLSRTRNPHSTTSLVDQNWTKLLVIHDTESASMSIDLATPDLVDAYISHCATGSLKRETTFIRNALKKVSQREDLMNRFKQGGKSRKDTRRVTK
ncbi:hypothetical protein ACTXT7_005511 [Hymenolepis weldensis]